MKKNISISLEETQIKKIDDICRVSERTKSWLVKKALDNYFEDMEDAEIAYERSFTDEKDFLAEPQLREKTREQEKTK